MSYLDVTLTPASGYAYVHTEQAYQAIAAQLDAHPNWEFVEEVTYTNSPTGSGALFYNRVWRCLSVGSGLINDFYVIFTSNISSTSGVPTSGAQWGSTASNLQVSLCETYDPVTNIASKFATVMSSTSFTMGADRTHPATWNLGTQTRPGTISYSYLGTAGSAPTSVRMIVGVTPGVFFANFNPGGHQVYVGAFDSFLGSEEDPMPLVIGTNNTSYSSFSTSSATQHMASTTRHPRLTPSVATTYAFGHHFAPWHAGSMASQFGNYPSQYPAITSSAGILGDPTNKAYSSYLGGLITSRVPLATSGTQFTGETRGGWRGYLRHMRIAQLVGHNFGDTFDINGRDYVGFGSTDRAMWDTAA